MLRSLPSIYISTIEGGACSRIEERRFDLRYNIELLLNIYCLMKEGVGHIAVLKLHHSNSFSVQYHQRKYVSCLYLKTLWLVGTLHSSRIVERVISSTSHHSVMPLPRALYNRGIPADTSYKALNTILHISQVSSRSRNKSCCSLRLFRFSSSNNNSLQRDKTI